MSLHEMDAGANACSVEWCPVTGLDHFVACATYLLNENPLTVEDAVPDTNADTSQGGEVEKSRTDRNNGDIHCDRVGDDLTSSSVTGRSNGHISGEMPNEAVGEAVGRQMRTGTLVLHKLSCDTELLGQGMKLRQARLEEAARISLDGGILDSKWRNDPLGESAIIACATSTGRVTLHALRSHADRDAPETLETLSTSNPSDRLLLSLDWNEIDTANEKTQVVVSESDGSLSVWRCHPGGGEMVCEQRWSAHVMRGGAPAEAWITFFSRFNPFTVISGADDGLMKGWDLRACGGEAFRAGHSWGGSPSFVCRHHGAGVTSGQWHPSREHVFASGSYDEDIRLWDIRNTRDSVSQVSTGGGLWRLKWHPSPEAGQRDLLLAACMHAGVCGRYRVGFGRRGYRGSHSSG
ncbi:unnamed protein product [Choristocarpus tenellus]